MSDDRAQDKAGVGRQEKDCRELAAKRGWKVAGLYVDNDTSAFSGRRRPEYERLMEDLRSGAVDAVLAWHPDRLHRSPVELERFIDVVESSKAAVLTVKAGDLDLGSATGRQTARIVGAIARGESERMGERIRRKHEEIAAAGRVSGGGSRPFGYESDRVTIRASEARHVRDAARRVLAGDSLTGIVHGWNAAGIETTGGKVWDVTGLRQVLASPRISGRREHRGEIVGRSVWKGIITPELSDRLRSMLGPARGRRPGPPTRFLLTGFLHCGRCGVALSASRAATRVADRATAGKYATLAYACSRHARSRPTACGRLRVRAEPLEELLSEMIFDAVDSPRLAVHVAERRKGDRKRETAANTVAQLEDDLQRLAADFGAGRVPYSEWSAARAPLDRRLVAAREQLDVERGTLPLNGFTGKTGALRRAWPGLTLDRKRAILGTLLERVTIQPVKSSSARNRFDPDRVEVEWRF